MRRQQIQLLAAARGGNTEARCRVGRHYLLGDGGFPRHVATGLDYLLHPSVALLPCASHALCDALPLHELLDAGLMPHAERAARGGHAQAALHCAAWQACRPDGVAAAAHWLSPDAAGASALARAARTAMSNAPDDLCAAAALLGLLAASGSVDLVRVLDIAARHATQCERLDALTWPLKLATRLQTALAPELQHHVVAAIDLAEVCGQGELELPAAAVESALGRLAESGHARAVFHLARALTGSACGPLPACALVARPNARKGAALLLRAADAGEVDAWLHLHRLSADHRSSVANPQLARFCLEKAACAGHASAQLRLGVMLLRESSGLADSERALGWIHAAHGQGEPLALQVLRTLVLPVPGDDARATEVLRELSRSDPWLAARLALARRFGLTRLEALSVHPPSALRPWGLVVGLNPYVRKPRLAAARAVPAVSAQAAECLRAAASLFAHREPHDHDRPADLLGRKRRLRVQLEGLAVDEGLFFADASAATLDALRRGPRWAARARSTITAVLGDGGARPRATLDSGLSAPTQVPRQRHDFLAVPD